ncbi:MAG: hypothetical protein AB1632_08110 [Nitrospirota bacterium]
MTVPARKELWSSFDELSYHKRRYAKKELRQIFAAVKLNPLLIEYMFISLYLPMRYVRLISGKNDDPFKINSFFNAVLLGCSEAERFVSNGLTLPIGTSLIGIARKNY